MAANYIKKEDVSTDNIYEYEYADGAFSGYWLKFKYVEVPMDTRDPFNPVQNDNAYAVYDAYIFESELSDVTNLIGGMLEQVDFFYVEESVYQTIATESPKYLDDISIIPYQITDNIITVNKYYLPADFDIADWETEPDTPVDPDEPVTVVYVTATDFEPATEGEPNNDYNINLGQIINGHQLFALTITGHIDESAAADIIDDTFYSISPFSSDFKGNDYFSIQYNHDSSTGNHQIWMSTNEGNSTFFVGNLPADFNVHEDHKYFLIMDISDSTSEYYRFTPYLHVDDQNIPNEIDGSGEGTYYEYKPYVEFDITGGTTEADQWAYNFQYNMFLFYLIVGGTDNLYTNDPLFLVSDVIIHYDFAGDPSTSPSLHLTPVDEHNLTDGTNNYRLQKIGSIIK